MGPSPRCPAKFQDGEWRPFKGHGRNLKSRSDEVWCFNGTTTTTLSRLPIDNSAHLHSIVSMYHDRGKIWTVDYDATRHMVADGWDSEVLDGPEPPDPSDSDSESGSSSTLERGDDWTELSFGKPKYADGASYVGHDLDEEHLLHQREDQAWPALLLPERYHPGEREEDPTKGGLVGELAVLLALVAMTMPPRYLNAMVPRLICDPWRLPPTEHFLQRCGRTSRRGLVVTVWARSMSRPNQDEVKVVKRMLKDHEHGFNGVFFS